MKKLLKKDDRGFTLAELLIVVAIIAVLVAISIPIFTKQLEKSREATDLANMRAAYAIVSADALTGDYKTLSGGTATAKDPYTAGTNSYSAYYDTSTGTLVKTASATTRGNGTGNDGGTAASTGNIVYTATTNAANGNIKVTINETDGNVTSVVVSIEPVS